MTLDEKERLAFANALAAAKLEWDVGVESKAIWKRFVEAVQKGETVFIGQRETPK